MDETPTLAASKRLLDQLLGKPSTELTTPQEVYEALKAGRDDILVEVPWGEFRGDELHERHQIILVGADPERVYFINALKSDHPRGSDIAGMGEGPPRHVEARGFESMTHEAFVELFAKGGLALLPGK